MGGRDFRFLGCARVRVHSTPGVSNQAWRLGVGSTVMPGHMWCYDLRSVSRKMLVNREEGGIGAPNTQRRLSNGTLVMARGANLELLCR